MNDLQFIWPRKLEVYKISEVFECENVVNVKRLKHLHHQLYGHVIHIGYTHVFENYEVP